MADVVYKHEAQSDLPGVAFHAMRQVILAQAKTSGLEVLEDAPGSLTVQTAHGLIGLRPGAKTETAGLVAAQDPVWLFNMKNAVVQQMRHLMPEVAEAMRWSDGDSEGSLPPNFRFVRATDVQQLGSVFLRVTLVGEDLSNHRDESIHFRLLQPPKDVEAEWPSVAPNGSTVWPDGPGAPHKPVYTTRSIDHRTNTLVTDVYIHEGGRTYEWAKEIMEGERGRRVVGLIGPSGGGLLDADRVLLASDETGFPAAARLLENLPEDAAGELLLEADEGEACDYPITAPDGIRVRWLARSKGESLADETLAALDHHIDANVWFAGEKGDARKIRETAKSMGWDAKKLRVSGFWSSGKQV
ncbi:MAG: siderophore-interacting protein [Pseudomonadota bacterium]